jgi:chitinase
MRRLTGNRDHWAKTISPNQDVTVYIGAPADPLAATTGYVEVDTLASYALQTSEEFSSFGGVMLWDASYAYGASLVFLY